MDYETKIKIDKSLHEYFHHNKYLYNYPAELEGLKVKASKLLELIEENHNDFWRDISWKDLYPEERAYLDEPTWMEILESAIPHMKKQIAKYEELIKKYEMKK